MEAPIVNDYLVITEYTIAATINCTKANNQKYRAKSRIFVCRCWSDVLRLASSIPPTTEIIRMVTPIIATIILASPLGLFAASFDDSILISLHLLLCKKKGYALETS